MRVLPERRHIAPREPAPGGGRGLATFTRWAPATALCATVLALASGLSLSAAANAAAPPAEAAGIGAPLSAAVSPPPAPAPAAHTSVSVTVIDNGVAAADQEARTLAMQVFGSLGPPETALLGRVAIRLDVVPLDRALTDLPDFTFLRGQSTFDGRPYSELRGVGPTLVGSVVTYAVGAEQVVAGLTLAGITPYGAGYAVCHESGHLVRHLALSEPQGSRLRALYGQRRAAGAPWVSPYSASNDDEYFADATAAWFGHPWSDATAARFTRAWLRANDPAMAAFLQGVYARS